MTATPSEILQFWFEELTPRQWYRRSARLDADMAERFGSTLDAAGYCELWQWRDSVPGRLAEIIVLDQFSRNIHRDTAAAFDNDPLALALAQEAVARGADRELPPERRAFMYMPYMHSESATIHEQAMVLFDQPGLETEFDFEHRHREIIQRFGRYPHRNAALGRTSTSEEVDFLSQPGSAF